MTHEEIIAAVESMTVLELADLVKAMEEKFGVSAAATAVVAGPAAGAAAPAAEEKTEFDVVLAGFDAAAKIKVIKAVREITGLGLKEAKEVVDNAPKTVKEGLSKAEAEDLAARKQLLDAAEQDGRIDATTRPIYENLLANDRENGEKALAQLPVKRRVMEDLHLEPNGEESPWNRRMREIKDKRKK